MSKNLGKTAAAALIRDFFGNKAPKSFRLRPPEKFDLFNSLRLVEIDTFSGLTVTLIRSILWLHDNKVVSQFKLDNENLIYSGTHEGELPQGLVIHSKNYWLTVSSRQLGVQDKFYSALEARGCIRKTNEQENFFMFLRAHDLITFDASQEPRATMEIKSQHEDSEYENTPVAELYSYYEPIAVFSVNSDSPLTDRPVFWYSYLVASTWKEFRGSYINQEALNHLEKIYDNNLWHFPIDNARTAITATHFKHSFIELYRCLEWLYSLPRSLRLKNELKLSTKGTELARAFRDKLAWRRAELDSLRLLILDAEIENLDIKLIQACLLDPLPPLPVSGLPAANGQPEMPEKWLESVASLLSQRIYAIRNQFVHQIDAMDRVQVLPESESAFILLLAKLCAILYEKYAPEF